MLVSYLLLLLPWLAHAAPTSESLTIHPRQTQSTYWLSQIQRQGTVAYSSTDPGYRVFRNVKDYGAVGDGVSDDTIAINNAISDGPRCAFQCDSSTLFPAIIYFPPGRYGVSAPIVQLYYTQFIGDALDIPTIVALPYFEGLAVVDTDPYIPGGNGAQWYTNQNNFYRQMRNFNIDITQMPEDKGAGIHWQVAQATSLQNIVFHMRPKSPTNRQQGIFMDNGSGGLMSDLVFNGGNYGAFLGNQQFTTRNLTFNGCNTAIYVNWDWLWTFKSLKVDGCDIGIDMSNLANATNQTVGSVLVLDAVMTNTAIGIKTSYNVSSLPSTGGTLVLQNVDFGSTQAGVVGANGVDIILAGSQQVQAWYQGDTYRTRSADDIQPVRRAPQEDTYGPSQACPASCTATTIVTTTVGLPFMSPMPGPVYHNGTIPWPNNTATSRESSCTATLHPTSTSAVCTGGVPALEFSRLQKGEIAPNIAQSLLNGQNVFERSKPQYEEIPVSFFVSVKSAGAAGDGITDDTMAIQNILNSVRPDQIVYVDHGAYVVTRTIEVPANIRITGEIWPLIMARGSFFSDMANPQPVFRVGHPGDTGSVELSDLIFETVGALPGAIMMEWNVAEASQGSCAMWDVHFRIGGSAGTQLEQDTCLAKVPGSTVFKPECAGSFLMMHITSQATAYVENCWFWVADHELDIAAHNQTNVYNGRGLLVESHGPVWLYGTSSEHHQLYNYQLDGARDVFMATIQAETAYMQSAPKALDGGFPPVEAWNDPSFAECTTDLCKKTWGLRILESENVYLYGAGLYSFFDNYQQVCLETESCQENMIDIRCSSNINLYGVTTKASTNMINVNGQAVAVGHDHMNWFGQTLASFEL